MNANMNDQSLKVYVNICIFFLKKISLIYKTHIDDQMK